jgi:hypothetical protein
VGVLENKLWSHPKCDNQRSKTDSKNQINQDITSSKVVKDGLHQIESIQNEGYGSPSEIAFGSENEVFIHSYIIAGKSSIEKGRAQ